MVDLTEQQLAEVRRIIAAHAPGLRAWAYGSHVTGTARRFSGLYLALEGAEPIPLGVMGDLRHAFEESDLPFSVDLLDLRCASPVFRRIVLRQRVPL